jgi:hypothetical protein
MLSDEEIQAQFLAGTTIFLFLSVQTTDGSHVESCVIVSKALSLRVEYCKELY